MNKITVQLKADTADENVTLQHFAEQMKDFHSALCALDQHISVRKRGSTVFRVLDLTHSSPSAVTIGAFPSEDSLEDNSDRVFPTFLATIESINAGKIGEALPLGFLEPVYRIAKSLNNGMGEILLKGEGRAVFFTERIETALSEMLEEERVNLGAIKGTIDYINVHKGTNTFRIYPLVGPSYVTCEFPENLKTIAKEAIERYVQVYGKIHYKVGAQFPHRVDVQSIEILPDEKELPTLASLQGIATGSGAFLDDGWE